MKRALITLALVATGACAPGPEVVVVGTRALGPIFSSEAGETGEGGEGGEGIASRTRGYSLFGFGRSIWLFGDTRLRSADAQGSTERSNSWSFTFDLGAEDGIDSFVTPTDEWGGPAELLVPTAEELAVNAEAEAESPGGGPRLLLWPMAAVRNDGNDQVLVFYAKSRRSAAGEISPIGSSLAIWANFETGPIRPVLAAGGEEPTLLFHAPEPAFGQAALIVGDQLYAYGCTDAAFQPCMVARVELERLFDRSAWEVWTGREWSSDLTEASAVLEAGPVLSVHYNHHVRRYLALYSEPLGPLGAAISLRSALAPEGPWSGATRVLDGAAGGGDGLFHSEYRLGSGQFEYLSYHRGGSLELVEVELAAGD